MMPRPMKPNFDFDGLMFFDLSVSEIVSTSSSCCIGMSKMSIGQLLMTARAALLVVARGTGDDDEIFLTISCV